MEKTLPDSCSGQGFEKHQEPDADGDPKLRKNKCVMR